MSFDVSRQRWEADELRGVIRDSIAYEERLEAAIQRVRELHSPFEYMTPKGRIICECNHDEQAWPCETIKALGAAARGEDKG